MKKEELAEKLKGLLGKKKTAAAIIAVGVLGMFLIAFDGGEKPAEKAESDCKPFSGSEYGRELESRLETTLSEIQGVGEVHVMITLSSSEEYVYAEETDTAADRQQTEYVIVDKGGIVTKVNSPAVTGAVVVCEGGGNSRVCEKVYSAVSVSLGLPSNRISVLKMK